MDEKNIGIAAGAVPATEAECLSLGRLGWIFLRIGSMAFGGLGAGLALIERDLVENRRLLSSNDVTESLTYTKLLPGSTLIQVVAYLGFKLRGWPGSAFATAAFILPSAVMMLFLAVVYGSVGGLASIGPAVNGLTAAVVGLLLAATYRLGKANIKEPLTMVLGLMAFAAGGFFGVNAAAIVVAAGIVGVFLLSSPVPEKTR